VFGPRGVRLETAKPRQNTHRAERSLGSRISQSGGVDVDSRLRELIALSMFAAFCCGVTWTLDQNFLAAIFAAESATATLAAKMVSSQADLLPWLERIDVGYGTERTRSSAVRICS
jgi:hypothetical protein